MRKNIASQNVAAQVNSATDGTPLTTGVSVFVTIDGGTQGAGGGTTAHKGNGHWNYAPTQAETNGNPIEQAGCLKVHFFCRTVLFGRTRKPHRDGVHG